MLRYLHFETGERRQPQVAHDYGKWFLARLRTLEPLLSEQPFLCVDRFTAADVSVGYALLLALQPRRRTHLACFGGHRVRNDRHQLRFDFQ